MIKRKLVGDDTGLPVERVAGGSSGSVSNKGTWSYDPLSNQWNYIVNGQLARNTWFESDVTGTNCWYAVDGNGNMLTGLVIKDGNVYYLQEQGSDAGKLLANAVVSVGALVLETDEYGKVIGDISLFAGLLNIYDMDKAIIESQVVEPLTVPILENAVVNFANTQLAEGFIRGTDGNYYYMEKQLTI